MYHEYIDRNGKLVRRHYNGQARPVIDWAANTAAWKQHTEDALNDIIDLIGKEAYLEWLDTTPDWCTWQERCRLAQQKIAEIKLERQKEAVPA